MKIATQLDHISESHCKTACGKSCRIYGPTEFIINTALFIINTALFIINTALGVEPLQRRQMLLRPARERISFKLMTSDRKVKASREGSQ